MAGSPSGGRSRFRHQPLASAAGYAEALPSGELRVIAGAGHLTRREEPVDFFTAVNAFPRRGDL